VVQDGEVARTWSSLVNPCRPIPPYATAVHGICDDDVADAPNLRRLLPWLHHLCAQSVIVAHNASFDTAFLPSLVPFPVLCTLQLARRAFPDAPNHRNQTLRNYLDIDRRCDLHAAEAHSALGDALVTAGVLLRCLEELRARAPRRNYAPRTLERRGFQFR